MSMFHYAWYPLVPWTLNKVWVYKLLCFHLCIATIVRFPSLHVKLFLLGWSCSMIEVIHMTEVRLIRAGLMDREPCMKILHWLGRSISLVSTGPHVYLFWSNSWANVPSHHQCGSAPRCGRLPMIQFCRSNVIWAAYGSTGLWFWQDLLWLKAIKQSS